MQKRKPGIKAGINRMEMLRDASLEKEGGAKGEKAAQLYSIVGGSLPSMKTQPHDPLMPQ